MELLEREPHLAQLEAHLRQAVAGQGRLVFLAGEAGVGKTALTEAFRRRIAGQFDVLHFSCDALSTPGPLGPVRDLAAALGLPGEPRLFEGESREHLFRAILAALTAHPGPIVLIGEDAHWSDGATLDILRFLGRRVGALPYLHLVTYRDDEIGATHPLRLVLGDLATASTVHRLKLPPLSPAAVRQMAEGSGRDAAALHRLTGGNPFFLTEVLATEGAGVPTTVGDAVLARAARLSPEARGVLDVASVIGSSIDLELLQKVAGPVLDEIDACIERGLLLGHGDGLAFRHELAREAIMAAIAPPRRRLLHSRVLQALRDAPQPERKLAHLAHHAEAAGDREAVLEFATAAAEQAARSHAHREAAAQYARALRYADGLPAAERARLFAGRSIACYLSDQGAEAIAARQAALDLWRSVGDPLQEGESLRWLSRCHWFEGHGDEAEQAASAALAVLEPLGPGPQLAMAYSNLAQLCMLAHDREGTLRWGQRAIDLAEQIGETETLVHALSNVGAVRGFAGDGQGEEELTRSLTLAQEHDLPDHAGRALTNLTWSALWAMQLDEADRRLATAIAYAIEHDLDNYRWYLVATRAMLRDRQGAWDAAEADALDVLRQAGTSPLARIVALTTLGNVRAHRGEAAAEVAATLDEALALAERTGQLMRLGPARVARADAALLAGDISGARRELLALRDLVVARGERWQRGELAWLLWQVGDRDLPAELDPAGLPEPYARQIAGDFAGAAAAWRELGCPYEEARALAASDDPAQVRRAVATFERLGAAPAKKLAVQRLRALGVRDLPVTRRGPRASTRANPAGLTQREAEVLALLAEGLRNAEIAERLFLTPKTVGHHISSILAKLGVETRTEAARAAAKLGLAPS